MTVPVPEGKVAVAGLVPLLGRHAVWLDLARTAEVLLTGTMTGADWAHLATSVGLWVALPLAAGTVLLHRREIA